MHNDDKYFGFGFGFTIFPIYCKYKSTEQGSWSLKIGICFLIFFVSRSTVEDIDSLLS